MYDTIIIGAGAAGLFIGANLIQGKNLILESQPIAGSKILITGGGMCNITNIDTPQDFILRFGDKTKVNFLKPALMNLTPEKTWNYLEEIGLNLIVRDDGKVFPESLKAQSLIDRLLSRIRSNSNEIYYNNRVEKVVKGDKGFIIKTSKGEYRSKNLVFATGGASFPNTGSDGSGYKIARDLGHKIINIKPALTGVKVANTPFKELSGISIKNSYVQFFSKDSTKRYLAGSGDLLFTHQGISGPIILNNSRVINPGDRILFSLISSNNIETSREDLVKRISSSRGKTVKQFLKELGISKSLGNLLIKKNSITKEKLDDLNKKETKKLLSSLLQTEITVNSLGGFNSAMVTAGGVNLKDINRKTMESKIIPGLYFAGEVLDIDGDTGGYNIQGAFSTGKLISDHLNQLNDA